MAETPAHFPISKPSSKPSPASIPTLVTADLNAAADYALKLPAANGKLAVIGFCWGGGKSFLFATQRHDLSAAFVFYGPPPPNERLSRPSPRPFTASMRAMTRASTATVPDTKTAMAAAGKKYDPVIYDGAGHGFMRAGEDPTNTNPANTAARTEALKRLESLLKGM